jgi:hypothetical protein
MKTAFLVDDDVVHGGSPLSCVHSANSERGHCPIEASLNAAASSPKRSISCIHQGSATALSAAEKPPKCLIVSTSVTLDVK